MFELGDNGTRLPDGRIILHTEGKYAQVRLEPKTGGGNNLEVETGAAAQIVPYFTSFKQGRLEGTRVVLLQQERHDTATFVLKGCGGYLNPGEDEETCIWRNLQLKANTIQFCVPHHKLWDPIVSKTVGYGSMIRVPIVTHFVCISDNEFVPPKTREDNGLVSLSLASAIAQAVAGTLYDDSIRLALHHLQYVLTNRARTLT